MKRMEFSVTNQIHIFKYRLYYLLFILSFNRNRPFGNTGYLLPRIYGEWHVFDGERSMLLVERGIDK